MPRWLAWHPSSRRAGSTPARSISEAGLPLEQVPMRHEHADSSVRAIASTEITGLVRKEHDGQRRLLARSPTHPADGPVVCPPGLVERRTARSRARARRPTARRSRRGRAASSERGAREGPSTRRSANSSCDSSTVLRRRLSMIFHCETSDRRLGSRPSGPGTRRRSHGSSCQSPRIQRCLRRV